MINGLQDAAAAMVSDGALGEISLFQEMVLPAILTVCFSVGEIARAGIPGCIFRNGHRPPEDGSVPVRIW